jgi:hypothetical protein
MNIKRDDIDNRKVDFSDIASGRRLPPVHPGKILRDEFLTPMGISVYELANAIKVPRTRDSPRPILRHFIGVLDQSSDALRPGRSRPHGAASDRAGNLAPRGLTEPAQYQTVTLST